MGAIVPVTHTWVYIHVWYLLPDGRRTGPASTTLHTHVHASSCHVSLCPSAGLVQQAQRCIHSCSFRSDIQVMEQSPPSVCRTGPASTTRPSATTRTTSTPTYTRSTSCARAGTSTPSASGGAAGLDTCMQTSCIDLCTTQVLHLLGDWVRAGASTPSASGGAVGLDTRMQT
jgi:hypothetical protein